MNKIKKEEKNKENFKIIPLSPKVIESEYVEEYLKRLRECIKNKEINNIAITGNYGTGKSSVIKTYLTKNNIGEKEYIKINLANYIKQAIKVSVNEPTQSDKLSENSVLEPEELLIEQRIEDAIIKQLLFSSVTNDNYESTFKTVSNNFQRNINKFVSLYITIFIVCCLFVKYLPKKAKKSIDILLYKLISIIPYTDTIAEKMQEISTKFLWPILIILLFFSVIYMTYRLTILLLKNAKSISFQVKNSSVSIEANNEMSFAKNLKEIILHFSYNTKCSIVIFEDLDRYPKDIILKLMEELKKLNSQINSSPAVKQQVKFIYTFKEDIFIKREDKSKFYDYIISIMPVTSYYNSSIIIRELLKEIKKEKKIDKELIDILADEVYDYRTLISIVNDYDLFSSINKTDQDNKIFAMCIIKNYYYDKYNKILEHDNFIEEKFVKIDSQKRKINIELSNKIEVQNEKISKIKEENEKKIRDLKQLFWENCHKKGNKPNYIRESSTGKTIRYDEFIDSFNMEKIKEDRYLFDGAYEIDYTYYGSEEEFLELFKPKQERIKKCYSIIDSITEKINELDNMTVEEYKEALSLKEIELIDKLIISKYIERDYIDYITSPTSFGTNNSENKYIFNVKHNYYSTLIPLKNVGLVIEQLKDYFSTPFILNVDLINYIFNNDVDKELKNQLLSHFLELSKEKIDILYVLSKQNEKSFLMILKYLIDNKIDIWDYISAEDEIIKESILIGLLKIKNSIQIVKDKKSLYNFINKYFNDYSKVKMLNNSDIMDNLITNVKYNLRIKDINTCDTIAKDQIKNNGMYEFNKNNLESIFWKAKENISDYSSYGNDGVILFEHIKNNFHSFYSEYYLKEKSTTIGNNLIDDVLQLDLTIDMKKELFKREKFQVNIETIDEDELYELAILNNHIKPTWENIFALETKVEITTLLNFIICNKEMLLSTVEINKNSNKIEEHQNLLALIVRILLVKEHYKELNNISKICTFKFNSIHNLNDSNVKIINDNNLIEFDAKKIDRINSIGTEELNTYLKHWLEESGDYKIIYKKIKNKNNSDIFINELLKMSDLSVDEKIDIVLKEAKDITTSKQYLDIFLEKNTIYKINYKKAKLDKLKSIYGDLFIECKREGNEILIKYK